MGFLKDIKENREKTSGIANPAQWLVDMFNPNSTSGVKVTEENAMNNSAVYAAVRVIAETIASLPLNVYREDGRTKEKAKNNYLYSILHNKPNKLMTSFTWRETMMAHLLLWGNHYSQLERDNSGRITGIYPLLPGRTQVKKYNGKLFYIYNPQNGEQTTYSMGEILHIPGLGFNGLKGKSVIKMAREAVGLGLAAEEFGARFFSQGAQPGGIIEYPGRMSEDAYKRYKQEAQKNYSGLGNSHKIMVLEEGLSYTQTGIPPDDAQFLETRKFQIEEVARIFRVPPHMLADLERATFSNIEQQSIDFIVNTIRPWLVRIEQTLNDKLISNKNNSNYIKFVVEGLLRGDAESRGNFYNTMFNIGAMSINDIREKEDMNPIDGGDQSFVPLNMIPLESDNPKTENNSVRTVDKRKENRARRNAQKRVNIRERYKRLIKKSANNIVEREINKIQDLVNKELKNTTRNEQNFRDKMIKFYNEKFPGEIKDEMKPVLNTLAKAITDEATSEVDIDDFDLENFFAKYMDSMANKHSGYSRGQLLALMDEADDIEQSITLVEERLEDWEEKRADKVAMEQSVKVEGAITRKVFEAAGVTEIMWAAGGSACPICQEMDGVVVGVEENFLGQDETIQEKGGYSASGPKAHPPLHKGCDCGLARG